MALVFLLAAPADAVRRERGLVTAGRHINFLNASTGDQTKELRVFATSFNTGNRKFDDTSEFDDLAKLLFKGHEEPATEADIVFMGFQEFSDTKYGFGNMARERHLWREMSKRAMEKFKGDLEDAATPPAEVHAAKTELANNLKDFHKQIGTQFAKFREVYGEDGQEFHSHLAEASAVNVLSNKAKEVTEEVAKAIKKRLEDYTDEATKAPKLQFSNMTNSASDLSAWGDKFPTPATVKEKMAPIHAWTEGALNKIDELKKRYPNLAYSSAGESLWKSYTASIDNAKRAEAQLLSKTDFQREKFRKALKSFQDGVRTEVAKKEKAISDKLEADWKKVNADIKTLTKDLDRYTEDGKTDQSLAEGAKKGAKQHTNTMSSALSSWQKESGDLVHALLQPRTFDVKHSHVEVDMDPQKFDSGWACAGLEHYDTVMYAYVSPFSKWKITDESFHNDKCVERTAGSAKNPGCNIDNNKLKECGKVVNLMRFKAEQGGTSIRLCGLNTHMSFAGKAEDRMQYIKDAMDQTELAKCDTVFFMGDFNSRVHCEAGATQELPPFEREGNSGRSLDYILDEFCTGEKCALKDSKLDELNQILDDDKLNCYEKKSRQKEGGWGWETVDYWEIDPQNNPVKPMGLREVAPAEFSPTYKLKAASKIKDGAWKRCFSGEPMCFMNDSKKGKHNPAWTDRILMKSSSESIHLETTEYSRRPPPGSFSSDHSAVTAQVTVKIDA